MMEQKKNLVRDALVIPPGHKAWVIGNEPVIATKIISISSDKKTIENKYLNSTH